MVDAGGRFIDEPQTAGGSAWHHYSGRCGDVQEIMQRLGGALPLPRRALGGSQGGQGRYLARLPIILGMG